LVHKEVACLHSPVFKTAFNGSFVEGKTQTYRLEDTSVDVFRLLVQWLYSQKFKLAVYQEFGGGSDEKEIATMRKDT
jgi:BTB/POZ domain